MRPLFRFLILGLALWAGCSPRPASRRQEVVMGVFNEVVVLGKEKRDRERILDRAFKLLREIDARMSHYQETSEISRVNRLGYESPQEVSPETFEVIEASVKFYEKSGGVFDITVLPLVKLWGFFDGKPHLPRPEEIQNLLPRIGAHQLILEPETRKVGFRVPGMEIDLGGIAKGYACDRVVGLLKSEGIENALVNIGGTIFGLGRSGDGKPWRVGLQHPRDPTRTLRVITLSNEAVSTSGDYEQFFVVDGRRYSHILNPRTGFPADRSIAASVIAPSALLTDLLSTSLFILGPEKASLLAGQFPKARWALTYFSDDGRFKTLSSESVA